MQNYTEIPDTQTLEASRALLLNNTKSVMSCHSGISFPTLDLQIGMYCMRTDQSKLYQLTSTGPSVWKLIFDLALTATNQEYVDAQVGTKQNTLTGAGTTVTTANLTASRALVSNSSGKIAVSAATLTELSYLSGVTSAVQAQINGKLALAAQAADSLLWAGGSKTISTAPPSGGADGDIWFEY